MPAGSCLLLPLHALCACRADGRALLVCCAACAGVYVGCMYQEYTTLLAAADAKLSAATATGNSLSFMVGRLAYTFGLTGAQAVDVGDPAPAALQPCARGCGRVQGLSCTPRRTQAPASAPTPPAPPRWWPPTWHTPACCTAKPPAQWRRAATSCWHPSPPWQSASCRWVVEAALSSSPAAQRAAGADCPLPCLPPLAQALSPAARCKSFDASADGYGRGEGVAAAVLVPQQPGQRTLAVVRSSSVNQDGQSSSLTAPNGPSQTRLVLNALRLGGLAAGALRFVAVHGTGTPLGDPIEVGALGQALRGSGGQAQLALGSVKSCYGHTEGAAGLTGLLLAAAAANGSSAAPVMHLRSMNPYVEAALGDWRKATGLAAAIPRQQQPLAQRAQSEQQGPPLAGTSSFGMSGVNAHLLLSAGQEASLPAGSSALRLLRNQRLWPLPAVHPLLTAAMTARQEALYVCDLRQAPLAELWQQAVLGHPVLPAAAVLELLAASSQQLSEGTAVAAAALAAPVHPEAAAALTCRVQLGIGGVQLVAGSQLCATATAVRVLSAPEALPARQSRTAGGVLMLPLAVFGKGQQAGGVATPASSAQALAHGYSCHPAVQQAALDLALGAAALLSCALLMPGGGGRAASIAAAACSATLRSSGGEAAAAACGLQASPLEEMRRHRLASASTWPGWQLVWRPVEMDLGGAADGELPLLVVSTRPCPLSQLCKPDKEGSQPALAAVNAVWHSDWSAAGAAPAAEMCLGSEAHLQLLLGSCEAQHVAVAQLPPETAQLGSSADAASDPDVLATLSSYQSLLRCAGESAPRVSLLTFDAEDVPGFAPRPQPLAGLSQGECSSSWGGCAVLLAGQCFGGCAQDAFAVPHRHCSHALHGGARPVQRLAGPAHPAGRPAV